MSATPLVDAHVVSGPNPWIPAEAARGIEIQLRKEIAEATAENIRLRAALASSKDPCVYCQLPKDEMAKCRSGFPGCTRADDLMGCPELGASLEVDRLERELARDKRHTEVVMRTLKDALGIEDGRDCLEEVGRLKDKVKQLRHALSHVLPRCDYLHHPKKYQHHITEPCPVEELIRKAQNP